MGSHHLFGWLKGAVLRQGQLASHPQLKFQERREGHALVACWNSFEDEAHIKRFRRKNTEVQGGCQFILSRFHGFGQNPRLGTVVTWNYYRWMLRVLSRGENWKPPWRALLRKSWNPGKMLFQTNAVPFIFSQRSEAFFCSTCCWVTFSKEKIMNLVIPVHISCLLQEF